MKKIIVIFSIILIPFLGFSQDPDEKSQMGGYKTYKGLKGEINIIDLKEKNKAYLQVEKIFNTVLNKEKKDEFKFKKSRKYNENRSSEYFKQYYKGIPVKGGAYILHRENRKITSANGKYIRIGHLDTQPTIKPEQAKQIWSRYLEIPSEQIRTYAHKLIIVDRFHYIDTAASEPALAWKIRLYSKHFNNTKIGYVNAHTGKITLTEPIAITSEHSGISNIQAPKVQFSQLKSLLAIYSSTTGTFDTRYSGSKNATTEYRNNKYFLEDWTKGDGIETLNLENTSASDPSNAKSFSDNDNDWTASEYHNDNYDDAALDIHWALQEIYDYFEDVHERSGWDGDGQKVNAYIHGIVSGSKDNAAYYPDNNDEYLAFGDGKSTFYPLASIDVVTHEYGHGITDHTTDFGIQGIERSFHEGISDIWGAVIEDRVASNKETWKMGEEIMRNHVCLRNLADPDNSGAHTEIAHTYGTTDYNDDSGEYYRSGILSHWFYRLAEGGSGTNGLGNSYKVYGIGIECAAELIYYAQANGYLNGSDSYPSLKTNMINAAKDLWGSNTLEMLQVKNAWYAVGVLTEKPDKIYLSGYTPLCTSSKSYTIHNLPSGCSVSWSATPSHLFTNTSGSGSSFSTAWDGSGSGMGTITATLSGDCGSVDIIRNLWVGKPENYFDVSFNPSPVEEFASTTGTASSEGADSYIWDVINGTLLSGQGKSGVQIAAPSCDKNIWVKVTASNSCGESYAISSLEVTCRNKTRSLNIYPVPADDQMRVTIEGPTDDKPYIQTSQQSLHKYYLYNDRYMLVKQGNAPGNTFQVSTNHLPEGFYFLKVVTSKDTYTRKLEIRH